MRADARTFRRGSAGRPRTVASLSERGQEVFSAQPCVSAGKPVSRRRGLSWLTRARDSNARARRDVRSTVNVAGRVRAAIRLGRCCSSGLVGQPTSRGDCARARHRRRPVDGRSSPLLRGDRAASSSYSRGGDAGADLGGTVTAHALLSAAISRSPHHQANPVLSCLARVTVGEPTAPNRTPQACRTDGRARRPS